MNMLKTVMIVFLFVSALTDSFRSVSLGPVSLLALVTVASAALTWYLIALGGRIPRSAFPVFGILAFVLTTFFSFGWHFSSAQVSTIMSLQNIAVFLCFPGFLVLSCIESSRLPELPKHIETYLPRVTILSACLFCVGILASNLGVGMVMGNRAFALFTIPGTAWFLAAWRYRKPHSLLYGCFVIVTVVASFSRMVSVIFLLLAFVSQISLGSVQKILKTLFVLLTIVMISYGAFTFIDPINERFTDVGDNAQVAGVTVNTAGRSKIWEAAYVSAMEAPWLGQGPGSATIPVKEATQSVHPHNDYLRIFHDYGLLGVGLWVWGYGALLVKTCANWMWADAHDRENAHTHLGAFLALIGVALGMITDNAMIYAFVMCPLGMLVGASLGSGYRRRSDYLRSRASQLSSWNSAAGHYSVSHSPAGSHAS